LTTNLNEQNIEKNNLTIFVLKTVRINDSKQTKQADLKFHMTCLYAN